MSHCRAILSLVIQWFFCESPVFITTLILGYRLKIIQRIQDGTISHNAARQVFDALWRGEASDADAVIEAKGLKQMNDTGALEKIIDEVIAANPANVEQYRAGKDKAFNALVGQVMKASKGKANPQQNYEIGRASCRERV